MLCRHPRPQESAAARLSAVTSRRPSSVPLMVEILNSTSCPVAEVSISRCQEFLTQRAVHRFCTRAWDLIRLFRSGTRVAIGKFRTASERSSVRFAAGGAHACGENMRGSGLRSET